MNTRKPYKRQTPRPKGDPANPINRLMAAGWSVKAIAKELQCACSTVYYMRRRQAGRLVHSIVDHIIATKKAPTV